MAIILADGFDFYNSATDAQYVGSPWLVAGGFTGTTPYGVGRAAAVGGNSFQTGVLSNDTTIYFALSLFTSTTFTGGSTQGFSITLLDGASIQCTLSWAQDGNFYVRSGDWSSAPIAGTSFPHGMAPNSWCHWQGKVVINNTTGSVELRKNNNPINDYTKTGINTRNTSTNSYANKYVLQTIAPAWQFDDLFMCSGTGAAPNNWPGQLRAIQLMAAADTAQKIMTPSVGNLLVLGNVAVGSTVALSADTIYWSQGPFTAVAGAATKITVKLNAGFTGKMKCAIYTDNGASFPANLVAQTAEIVNPATGDNNFTFTPSVTLTDGVPYWLAFWANAALTPVCQSVGSGNLRVQGFSYNTNAGNFPAVSIPGVGTGFVLPTSNVTITVSNFGMVNELLMNSDTDYVYSSNPGDLDVYDLDDLTVTPLAIPLVATRVAMKKSDAGTRTACSQFKSGASTQDQTAVNLAVTYGWQMSYFAADPNTSAAWTRAGVNAIQLGVKVVT